MRDALTRGLAALGVLVSAACVTYRPAAIDALPADARVRVALTDAGSASLEPVLGTAVTGLVGEWGMARGDSVQVRVSRLLTAPGVDVDWTGAPVTLARGAVRSVERASTSRGRTALLVGAVAAGTVLVVDIVRRAGGAKGDLPGGGTVGF